MQEISKTEKYYACLTKKYYFYALLGVASRYASINAKEAYNN